MIVFGVGTLYGVPLTDSTGTAIAATSQTPVQFGTLQDVSADLSFDEKLLYGAYQFPVAFGRGKGKFHFKAKMADITAQVMGSLFFGTTPTAGIDSIVDNLSMAIPATPFTITASTTNTLTTFQIPSSGTWAQDLGVRYATTGLTLTRVASAPATGQYTVTAGVYVFAAADTALSVLISYEYTAASTSQFKIAVANQLMGQAPSFLAELSLPYNGKQLTLKLNNCVSSKLSLPFKNEDFSVAEFDFMALADASNNVGTVAFR